MLRATLTLLAGGALAQFLPLMLGPWITRLYTPVEFGHFSLVWTVAANVAVIGCARYEFALPLVPDDAAATPLLALCLRILAAVTLASALLGVAWAAWRDLPLALWLGLAVLAGAAAQAMTLWATRASRFNALALARLLQYGGGAVLQVALGLAALGAVGLMLGPIVASLAAALWLTASARPAGGWRALLHPAPGAMGELARRHRDFPLLNTPHAFAGALQDSLAMLLLAAWSGDASAGYWALAMRYLKAPAGLVGGALSQTLYPRLVAARDADEALRLVRQAMAVLAAIAAPLAVVLLIWGPALFAWAFGERWQHAGELARALAPYVAAHFIASPLAVTTMAWDAQAWALRLALVGQVAFVGGLAIGLGQGGLIGAAWGVSLSMTVYFGYYFWALARWKHKDGLFAT